MRWDFLVVTGSLLCLLLSIPAHSQDEGPIAYQPDILGVKRLFMVALNVPADAPEIKVTYPDSVTMLDRTPLPAKSELRKYYFRSLKPAKQADIVFAHPDGEITISIEIWSFEDLRQFRELKGKQLPRRWPLGEALPELKQSQTITTDAMKAAAKGSAGAGERWLDIEDETIWNLQPDSTIPRWHWVNVGDGCPVHGKEIFRKRAFYPWLKDSAVPYSWKIECPVGNEKYPSNDFANDDFTSGEFPDDGIGGACQYQGNKYGFIAELCQAYCHRAMGVAPQCANAYLATGDIRYVHKALVAMCRTAAEHAYLATMTHHRHRNRRTQVDRLGQSLFSDGPFLSGSGFTVYCIAQPGYQISHAEAYDKIWPAIDDDPDIVPFLQSQGFDVKTGEDVRRFIEENLFAVWLQGSFDRATRSNEPRPQEGLLRIAECLNYERGTEFMDWLYDSGGKMRVFVTNTYFRDGAPYEATGVYNGTHLRSLGPVIESIERLRQLRPDVYPEDKYPNLTKSRRYHHIFDFAMNTVTIDRTYPKIGDDTAGRGYNGGYPQYLVQNRRTWHSASLAAFEHAYKVMKDPKFAWALVNSPGWRPSLQLPYTREEIETEAAKWPEQWNDGSCLRDGFGVAVLRGGTGTNKRALWMMYGHSRGHVHDDIMHMGLDAHKSEILGQMGYPRNWGYWEHCWMTHILARQIPFVKMTATAQLFADAGDVHVCEAWAEGFSPKENADDGYDLLEDQWQRRMLALVDVSDEEFYCLDMYRIHGGDEHWWSFHAQEGEFATEGLQLKKQDGGTVAGPDVPYGDAKWLKDHGCGKSRSGWSGPMMGFPFLYNVERADMKRRTRDDGVWSADWTLKNSEGLHFKMTVPSSDGTEVIISDAKSPVGGSPYEMKWLLLHNSGQAPTRTQVVNVMEMYRDQPLIKDIRPLQVSGDDEAGFKPYGFIIELANGRTDTIFASADPETVRTAPGGFEFAGRFGMYSEQAGVPTRLVLVGGTRLTKDGSGITMDNPEYRAEITAVDRDTETVTVSPAPTNLEGLVGSYIYITNPVRRIAYKVLAAKAVAGGAELRLEFDSRIGTGKVAGHDDHRVKTGTPFVLQGWRYYHGARLVNADRTAEYQIIEVRSGNHAVIDPQVHPEVPAEKLAAEFPAGTWFDVYDYGVGDEVVWPQTASVTEVGQATYKVTATGKVTLSLPKNTTARVTGG